MAWLPAHSLPIHHHSTATAAAVPPRFRGVDAQTAACREWFAIPPTQRPHKKECDGWANTKRAAAAHDASLAPHRDAAAAWVANADSEAPQPSRVEPPTPRGWKQEYE